MNHEPPISPWYKQFWPWFLILVPLITMIFSFVRVHWALDTEDSLVIDDYYREGKAINASLDKVKRAQALGYQTQLLITDTQIRLTFNQQAPEDGAALQLQFFHPTLESQDFRVMLLQQRPGVYQGDLQNPLQGKWRLTLLPFHEQWKIQRQIQLPQNNPFAFNP